MGKIYRSYQTGEVLSTKQIKAGRKLLDRANEIFTEFEGWVHCRGSADQFGPDGVIIVSENDVIEVVRGELGDDAVTKLLDPSYTPNPDDDMGWD